MRTAHEHMTRITFGTGWDPRLNEVAPLPAESESHEDILAQLRAMVTSSSPPTAPTGIPLDDPAVRRWSALTIDLLARGVGLPAEFTHTGGGFGFVAGSAGEAARLAVAAALTRAGRAAGLTGTETVYVTARTAVSVSAAVLAAGLGRGALRVVDTTPATGRMCAAALARAVTEGRVSGRRPIMVAATVGDQFGAFDSLSAVSAVSKKARMWLHVDAPAGAYALVPRRRYLLAGVAGAQSVCLDPGVLVDTPAPCVAAWTNDPGALRVPTLIQAFGARRHHLGLHAPERALNLALALRCAGLSGLRMHARSQILALREIVALARADPQWTMAATPGAGSACVRVNSGLGRDRDDIVTLRVIARLGQAGLRTAHGAVLEDRPVIRIAPYRSTPLQPKAVWRELTASLAEADPRNDRPPRRVVRCA